MISSGWKRTEFLRAEKVRDGWLTALTFGRREDRRMNLSDSAADSATTALSSAAAAAGAKKKTITAVSGLKRHPAMR